jgi:ABC-2 type transport system permease protein
MTVKLRWVAFYTLLRKEIVRFCRMWPQTLLPPLITAALYFIIFGSFIGSQIGLVQGIAYIDFIVPGLILMTIINNAFANVVFSFYIAKFQREIEEIIVAPVPIWVIISAYVGAGFLRGITSGILVFFIALFFWEPQLYNAGILFLFAILTSLVFSLGGLLNGIFARKFDDITLFSTFILIPLTYLGGVFYSIDTLPAIWQTISRFNPILYMMNGFRYGMYGITDVNLLNGIAILVVLTALLALANSYLLYRGYGIKE